ncbi:MAG: hypothetical protein IPG96_03540 [Proteobacteria bacterium]|nr:hypothetical protein [Pseudomonadota bacterium]
MTKGPADIDEREVEGDGMSAAGTEAEPRDPISEPDIDVELHELSTARAERAGGDGAGAEEGASDDPAQELNASRRMAILVAALRRQESAAEAEATDVAASLEGGPAGVEGAAAELEGLALADQELSGDDMEELPTPPPLPELELDAGPSPWGAGALGMTVGEVRLPLGAPLRHRRAMMA